MHIIMQGQHYALPQVESTSKGEAPDDLHQVVYVKVKSHSITEQSEDQNNDYTSDHAGNTGVKNFHIVLYCRCFSSHSYFP